MRCQIVQVQKPNPQYRGVGAIEEVAENNHRKDLDGEEVVALLGHIDHVGENGEHRATAEEGKLTPHHHSGHGGGQDAHGLQERGFQ